MNREQVDKLLELYKQGLTSSEQEDALISELGDSREGQEIWFSYIKKHQRTAPESLENQILSLIQSEDKRKKRLTIFWTLAAASVSLVIVLSLIFTPWQQKEMSYEEKAAILEEAILLASGADDAPSEREILYEDEIICIYKE